MATNQLTWDELVHVARRTGVTNWRDPASGQPGRLVLAPSSHRGKRGGMSSVRGVTRHHTGTAEGFRPAEDYPTYQVVKEGRAGLENSLSAYGLGRWTGIYVFSEFLSWHAGAWSYLGRTNGNGELLGIEAEGTGARWTPFQREFYPRLCASALSFVGQGPEWMPRHADGAMPRGRKDDARNLWGDFGDRVRWYMADIGRVTYARGTPPPAPVPLPQPVPQPAPQPGVGTLLAGQTLGAGGTLTAGQYRLVMQHDGNLVEYRGTTPVWSTGTAGRSGAHLSMQGDGNLVLYQGRTVLWATGTTADGSRLVLQADGNVVVYTPANRAAWARW